MGGAARSNEDRLHEQILGGACMVLGPDGTNILSERGCDAFGRSGFKAGFFELRREEFAGLKVGLDLKTNDGRKNLHEVAERGRHTAEVRSCARLQRSRNRPSDSRAA